MILNRKPMTTGGDDLLAPPVSIFNSVGLGHFYIILKQTLEMLGQISNFTMKRLNLGGYKPQYTY